MKHLSGKEKKQMSQNLPKGYSVEKKDEITQKENIIFKSGEPFLITSEKKLIPHLKSVPMEKYSCIYVDKGAIPFVLKGADIMRPGIEKIDDDIKKGDLVIISNQTYGKPLALGYSLFDSEQMRKQEKGKSVEIIHYINDKYF